MAKIAWLISETHALIAAVRENPSLYDRRDPDYSRAKDVFKHFVSTSTNYIDQIVQHFNFAIIFVCCY